MKVTALIPDDLISYVRKFAAARNLTDSLIKALQEWHSFQKIKALNRRIEKEPLEFVAGISAEAIRAQNRKR
jgi:hypothetical protein